MTNRELLQKAMPLYSLTNDQWHLIERHIEKVSDIDLKSVLKTLLANQAKLETLNMVSDYYSDLYSNPISNKTYEIVI